MLDLNVGAAYCLNEIQDLLLRFFAIFFAVGSW